MPDTAGWVQLLIAGGAGALLTALANLLGVRNKSHELWSEEGRLIRNELRAEIERIKADYDEVIERLEYRIATLEKALTEEESKNTTQQKRIDELIAKNRHQSDQIARLTEEINRMRAEKGLPPIQSADDL